MAAVQERLTSLELCVQESALGKREQAKTDMKNLITDVKQLQLAITTISTSMSNVAKDVLDLRRSSTADSMLDIDGPWLQDCMVNKSTTENTHGLSQQFKAEESVSEWTPAGNSAS